MREKIHEESHPQLTLLPPQMYNAARPWGAYPTLASSGYKNWRMALNVSTGQKGGKQKESLKSNQVRLCPEGAQ